jgi:hypothetical protein
VGDDPFVPVGNNVAGGSSNANNYFITNIGKPSLVVMVVSIGLALGLSIGAVVMMVTSQTQHRESVTAQVQASERRTMDRAQIAEREARIALDEVDRLKVALKQSTDH